MILEPDYLFIYFVFKKKSNRFFEYKIYYLIFQKTS